MSDDIKLILPGDLPPEAMAAAASGAALSPEKLIQAEKEMEGRELAAEVLAVSNTELAPYKDDAPVCAVQSDSTAIPHASKHFGQVHIPAWMHGRCIGAVCGHFKHTKKGPICGLELIALQAGKSLKVISAEEVEAEFKRWAWPATEEEGE